MTNKIQMCRIIYCSRVSLSAAADSTMCSIQALASLSLFLFWYDIFVNCNWVATRWQQYSTHLHINN